MNNQASQKLTEAEQILNGKSPSAANLFEAVVAALTVENDYAELPTFTAELLPRIEAIKGNPKAAAALEPAAPIVEAETLYRQEQHDKAIAILTPLAARSGDDGVAEYARSALARWQKTRPGESTAGASPRRDSPMGDSLSDSAKAAALQLQLGKRMLERNPDSAPKYFERAIELAPDSPAAAEARTLLQR